MGRTVSRGASVYTEWHAKEADKIESIKLHLPECVYAVGKGEMIAYRSGKWQDGSAKEDYEHDFTSRPTVYHQDGEGREVKVSSFLKNDVLVYLGTALELLYIGLDGDDYEIPLKKGTILACTTDKKTVVILHQNGPIFIKGGNMRVTARGIVK